MRWNRHTTRGAKSLRRAARAARCLAGDDVAASLLIDALGSAPQPITRVQRLAADAELSERLAAEHGMTLREYLALTPDELIDLFWPEPKTQVTRAAAPRT